MPLHRGVVFAGAAGGGVFVFRRDACEGFALVAESVAVTVDGVGLGTVFLAGSILICGRDMYTCK